MLNFNVARRIMAPVAGCLCAIFVGGAPATAADLLSGVVHITNAVPTIADIYNDVQVTGPTTSSLDLSGSGYQFSFTKDTITFVNPYGPGVYGWPDPASFNGFILTFSGVPDITAVVNDPASQLTPFSLTSNATTIYLNLKDVYRYPGQTTILDVSFQNAVPEPAAWMMMLVGVAAIGAASRRRDRKLAA